MIEISLMSPGNDATYDVFIDNDTVTCQWGKVNGAISESKKIMQGNSKFSAGERAAIHGLAKVKKKMRMMYTIINTLNIEQEKILEMSPDTLSLVSKLTMGKKGVSQVSRKLPGFVSLKLNGISGRYEDRRLVSRSNKAFKHMNSLLRVLQDAEDEGHDVEGLCFEFYNPNLTLEEIVEETSKVDPNLQMFVFDRMQDESITQRLSSCAETVNEVNRMGLQMIGFQWVDSVESVQKFYDLAVENGHEGVVFRSQKGTTYAYGKRPVFDIKLKPTMDREYNIFDCVCDRTSKGVKVLSYMMETEGGDTFKVVPPGTHEYRNKLWVDFSEGDYNPIESMATLTFYEETKYGKPRHIVGFHIRNEDLEGESNES